MIYKIDFTLSFSSVQKGSKVYVKLEPIYIDTVEAYINNEKYSAGYYDRMIEFIDGRYIINEPNFKMSKILPQDKEQTFYTDENSIYIIVKETHPLFTWALIYELLDFFDGAQLDIDEDKLKDLLIERLPREGYKEDLLDLK